MLHISVTLVRRLVAGPFMLLVACLWPVLPSPGTAPDRAAAWVASQNGDLPRDAASIRLYPPEYQDAILAVLMEANERERLTPSQSMLFQSRHQARTLRQRTSLTDFVRALPRVGFVNGAELIRLQFAELVLSLVEESEELPDCECAVEQQGDFDCEGETYQKACLPNPIGNPFCDRVSGGCGLGEDYACNGVCYTFPELEGPIDCESGAWDPLMWRCTETPIAVDTTGEGIQLTDQSKGVMFDMGGAGNPHRTVWTVPGSGTAWLAMDRDGDGVISGASELFSNVTQQPRVGFPNGFLALMVLDEDHDGAITKTDPMYSSLRLWLDNDHDGISEQDELYLLADFGIARIGLNYGHLGRRDRNTSELRYCVILDFGGSADRWMCDVNLANRPEVPFVK